MTSTATPSLHPKDDQKAWEVVWTHFETCLKVTTNSRFLGVLSALAQFELTVEGHQLILDKLVAQTGQPLPDGFRDDLVEQIGNWTARRDRARRELAAKEASGEMEDPGEDGEAFNQELIDLLMEKIRNISSAIDIQRLVETIQRLRS